MYIHLALFQDPHVRSIEPTLGPKSGGSTITIYGKRLKTGGVVNAYIGDAYCAINRYAYE